MKKLVQRLTVIAFGIGLTSAAVIYFTHSEPKANAEPKAEKRDVPYMDGKWIRYSADFAKRQQIDFAAAAEGSWKPLINVTGTVTFDPERVGQQTSIVLGKHSGKASLRLAMREAGIHWAPSDAAVLDRIHKDAREQKRALDAEQVAAWAQSRRS